MRRVFQTGVRRGSSEVQWTWDETFVWPLTLQPEPAKKRHLCIMVPAPPPPTPISRHGPHTSFPGGVPALSAPLPERVVVCMSPKHGFEDFRNRKLRTARFEVITASCPVGKEARIRVRVSVVMVTRDWLW